MTDCILEVKNLQMQYDDVVIMRDLNFTINKGDIFVIMGGSGCGKSTLLRHLIGLMHPAKGQICYHGKNFWRVSEQHRQEIIQSFGVLFQGGALWSSMTLAENVALPLQQFRQLPAEEIKEVVHVKLALVGLSGYEHYYPAEISGGMRKRAGLARAMALDPEILYFDEPSAGLDPISAKRLDDLIVELSDSLNATIIMVSHELASLLSIATAGVFLDADSKTMLATGAPKALLKSSKNVNVQEFLRRGEPYVEAC